MKIIWTFIIVMLFLWCSPVSAEYCTVKSDGKSTSCIYKISRIPKNTQIVISYTQQGWSMLIAVFLDEFVMIEGDATVKPGRGEIQSIEHVTTRRDMTPEGLLMEAPIYRVSEELLRELGNSRGKIRFWLAASESKDKEVEVAASLFSDIDEFIDETKAKLDILFEDE